MNLLLFLCSLLAVKNTAAAVLEIKFPWEEDLSNSSAFIKIKETEDLRTRDPIHATLAVTFTPNFGIYKEKIFRCLLADPNECEVFYEGNLNINAFLISDAYLYVGTANSTILRCDLYTKQSCSTFYTASTKCEVQSLMIAEGYLYAYQHQPSTIIRCDLNQLNHCQPLYETDSWVWSFTQSGKYFYIGQDNGKVKRCSFKGDSCALVYEIHHGLIRSIASTENNLYILTWDGKLRNCSLKLDGTIESCRHVSTFPETGDIKIFNSQLYIIEGEGLHICSLTDITNCKSYDAHLWAPRIEIAYETYSIQNRYRNEPKICSWLLLNYKCPPLVTYYGPDERYLFEVHVKNGRLYNYQGLLVDTSNATEGHSGPAAIFAMGPNGRLLLSNVHSNQLIHTSSFFAGSPVAGAGEMAVINGVIKKMAACDDHYLADADLNKQVIQSLRTQGYTDPIESQTCDENHESERIK